MWKILIALLLFLVQEKIWKCKKVLFQIKKPIIHLYTICWNEEKMLPLFLEYYKNIIDHFYVYDNYSDDSTESILKNHKNITIHKFDTGGTINDKAYHNIKNGAWKQSRGKADWVIVVDMDELLHIPGILPFLKKNKHTIFKPRGFDMYSEKFPEPGKIITEQVKKGIPSKDYSKMVLFNPYKIVNIGYLPGAHLANPEGLVKQGENENIKLLHYKNLGLDFILSRTRRYRERLSETNKKMGWGIQYLNEEEILTKEFKVNLQKAKQVIP